MCKPNCTHAGKSVTKLASDPQSNYELPERYELVASANGRAFETIDSTSTLSEALYLQSEYRQAYGKQWSVTIVDRGRAE